MLFAHTRSQHGNETLDAVRQRIARRWWLHGRFEAEDEGQAALEFALVAPLMLLIVTGIITFGWALSNYVTLIEATNTGARYFAISRGQTGDPCALAVSTIASAGPSLTKANITTSFQVYTTPTASTTFTNTCSGATLNQGMPVIVTTSYPCSLKWYGTIYATGAACTLKTQTTEVLQ